MDLEQHLLRGIPRGEAADFFLRVRGKDKEASVEEFNAAVASLPEPERTALLKSASVPLLPTLGKLANAMPLAGGAAGAMPMTSPAAMPPTARGQNMRAQPPPALPPTAMGQQSSPGMKMAASDKSPSETGKERAHASLSAEFEKEKHHTGEGRGGLVGKLLGGAAGAAAMHHYGKGNPVATLGGAALGEHLGGQVGKHLGASHDRKTYEKSAEAFKLALLDAGMIQAPPAQSPSPAEAGAPGATPQPQGIEPQIDPATQQFLAMQQAGDAAAEQGESAYLRQQLEALRQESQAAVQQAQDLQQQQEMNDQMAAQYQAQVADATTKAMAAQDQVLAQQQAAAAMRMAFQQLRGTLLEAASQEPPSLTPTPATDQANAAASQAAGASSAPAPAAGPAGAAPNPGVPPAGMAPTGDDTVSTPAEKNEPTFEGAASTTSMNQKEPSGDAKTPTKEVLASASRPFVGKTASLRDLLPPGAVARLPHAAVGAALGAGLGAGEAFSSNEPLRGEIAALEANPNRNYKDTLGLAQRRARLTVGEFAEKHPAAMIGMGALSGGLSGAQMGPSLVASAKDKAEHLKGIGSDIKTIIQQRGAA